MMHFFSKKTAPVKRMSFVGIEGYDKNIYRWRVLSKGQHIFDVTVDINDPDLIIYAHTVAGDRVSATTGYAKLRTHLLTDPDGQPLGAESRVSTDSVKNYVLPRRHLILAELYVPGFDIQHDANKTDESA